MEPTLWLSQTLGNYSYLEICTNETQEKCYGEKYHRNVLFGKAIIGRFSFPPQLGKW